MRGLLVTFVPGFLTPSMQARQADQLGEELEVAGEVVVSGVPQPYQRSSDHSNLPLTI